MSLRQTQLGDLLCDQDLIILDLFKNKSVKCVGVDYEFSQHFHVDPDSKNLILILNQPLWLSEVYSQITSSLTEPMNTFYIGINRYMILGNDTNLQITHSHTHSDNLINFINQILVNLNYTVVKSGTYNNDRGRYFNFIQPLTWIYGVVNVTN